MVFYGFLRVVFMVFRVRGGRMVCRVARASRFLTPWAPGLYTFLEWPIRSVGSERKNFVWPVRPAAAFLNVKVVKV